MIVEPLSKEAKEYAKTFVYKSTDDSLFYNYLLSPALNKSLFLIPEWVAPNLITILSLCFNIISFALTTYDAGWDFTKKLAPTVTLIQGLTHFIYIILDNFDGKQARRTGTSSPFGMLLDHGCDAFTTVFVGFNVCHLLCLDQSTIYSFVCFLALFIGFYSSTHEGFVLGELHFSILNGADEGNLVVATGPIISWLFGNDIWTVQITILSQIITINVGQTIITLIFISSFLCAIESLARIYIKKGLRRLMYALTKEWLMFYNIIVVPVCYYYFSYAFYRQYFWLIMICISCLFVRLVIDMQIRLCTNMKLLIFNDVYVVLGNALFIVTLLCPIDVVRLGIIALVSFIFFSELIAIIIVRGNELMNVLEIKLLTIDTTKNKIK